MTQTIHAAVLHQPGEASNFRLEDRPIPVPAAGWVLVKVKAFGLNRSELMTRKGLSPNVKFPRILGIECVGEVVSDPDGTYEPGQKVAACMGGMGRDFDGGYAEYALLPKAIIAPFSSELPWVQLGALPEMFQTVYGSLHLALGVKKGQRLLIRGGTSSIGMLAAQMAKLAGLEVIATTRNADRTTLLLNNGADSVLIDGGELAGELRARYPAGVDCVLELIGTSTLKDSLPCAAQGGTVCMTGMLSEQWSFSDFAPMDTIPATVRLTTYDSVQIRVGAEVFQSFIRDVERGDISLPLARSFKLVEIVSAHQFMETNRAGGKIVVLTGS